MERMYDKKFSFPPSFCNYDHNGVYHVDHIGIMIILLVYLILFHSATVLGSYEIFKQSESHELTSLYKLQTIFKELPSWIQISLSLCLCETSLLKKDRKREREDGRR